MSDTWDIEAKQGGEFKDFEVPPDGAIPARICALIDIGYHDARNMKGEVYQRRCLVMGFELGEVDSKGNPFFMSKLYTLSLDLKAGLYAVVKQVHGELKLGDKFNPDFLANKPCLLQISHDVKVKKGKERTYANIESVGRPPRGTITPPGSCIVWRVSEQTTKPLPDVSHLPPLWNEVVGKMLTVPEWAGLAGGGQGQRAASPNPSAVEPVGAGSDVPF